jgi:N-acetylglucosamine-6-sulfatase
MPSHKIKLKITILILGIITILQFPVKTNAQTAPTNLIDELFQEGITGQYRLPANSDYRFDETTNKALEFNISAQAISQPVTVSTAPNIVVILTDDQPPDTLSITGNPIIKTPHIDSLATNGGVYFKNSYTTTDICAPSRSTLLTGKMPHSHGVQFNNLLLPTAQTTIAEILRSSGYDTAAIGKCHLGSHIELGFNHQVETGAWPYWPLGGAYPVIRNGVTEQQTEYHTTFLVNEAIKYLNERVPLQSTTRKPFFMWLALNAPHARNNPPATPNRYSVNQFTKPVSWADDLSSKPPQQSLQSPHQVINFSSTPISGRVRWEDIQAAKEAAYEEISMIDDGVGRIKQRLRELGVADNTVIIFLADNGLFYGEHQLFQKASYFYEEQVKSPLIINYPRIVASPGTKNTYVSTLDFAPTILSFAGINQPTDMQGKSLLPYLKGQTASHRQSAFFEFHSTDGSQAKYFPMRGLVMNGYKLIHHVFTGDTKIGPVDGRTYTPDGKDYEFYNLNADPKEMVNLAQRNGPTDVPLNRLRVHSTYGPQVRKMLREIAVWQTNTNDPIARVLSNLRYTWVNSSSLRLDWSTPDSLTSEAVFKEVGCSACTLQEKFDFVLTPNHSLTLTGLSSGKSYDVNVFSISENGNGVTQYIRVPPGPTSTPTATPTNRPSPTPSNIPTRTPTSTSHPGDVSGDGLINVIDIGIVIDSYNRSPIPNIRADINRDGIVNILDIGIIVDNYSR